MSPEEEMKQYENAIVIDDIHETYPPKDHKWVRIASHLYKCPLHNHTAFIPNDKDLRT